MGHNLTARLQTLFILIGLIIVFAVYFDQLIKRRRR